jgi:hypothetical protein
MWAGTIRSSLRRIRIDDSRDWVMIDELDTVVLTRDVPDAQLKRGDVGAVVHVYEEGDAFEVEFVTADGRTIGLLTLMQDDIRPMAGEEILHVRRVVSA